MDHDREDVTASVDLVELFHREAGGLAGAVRAVLGPGIEVQEVLQEAFLHAWRKRASLPDTRDARAWVFVLTMNLARDLRRRFGRRGPRHAQVEAESMEMVAREPGPEDTLMGHEALGRARAAIARLADEEKEVFLLRTSAGLSFEGVAEALAIPVGTAKTRMRRALHRLRRELSAFLPPVSDTDLEGGAR